MGGLGVVVLAVAILPLLGVGGAQLFKAETPGPMKDTKLTPRITETAKGLYGVYVAITIACILALKLAGMTWLDAVIHAFSTMGLGGFSSHDASFAFFDSPVIEAVTIVFMLIASLNFATHFLAWRGRSLRPYRRDPEAGMVMLAMLGSAALIAIYLWQVGYYPEFWTSLRFAAFNVVSIASTTGFANTDFNVWPIFAPLLDALSLELRDLVRIDRRRHQDDPGAGAVEAVDARVHADPPSARRGAAQARRRAGGEQRDLRGARVHARVRTDDRRP